MLLKERQEESRRKELEETQKCEEEVAHRDRISAARAELEIKHFEEKQGKRIDLIPASSHDALLHHDLFQPCGKCFLIEPQKSSSKGL